MSDSTTDQGQASAASSWRRGLHAVPTEPAARLLWQQWHEGQRPDLESFLAQAGALAPEQLLAVVRVDQHLRWHVGAGVGVENYLERFPALADLPDIAALIHDELLLRQELGETGIFG